MKTNSKNEDQRLLTVHDVAIICGVSSETIRRLTNRGAMPKPLKQGRAVRYRTDEIDRWIAEDCPDLSRRKKRAS